MEWGYTRTGDRRHVLAEELIPPSSIAGISLCGILLLKKSNDSMPREFWPICLKCETLLSAMESV